jgi:hypothetical protein
MRYDQMSQRPAAATGLRLHESLVQLVDPLNSVLASRTTYLWCIRSGMPGTGLTWIPIDLRRSMNAQSISGGGGSGTVIAWSWLNMSLTATPRFCAAANAAKSVSLRPASSRRS